MLRSTFSTTTIASSTTMPIASTSPNRLSALIEKPNTCITREGADHRHRHGEQRNDRGAPGLQEQDDDQHHERDRFEQRVHHRFDRGAHELRRVVDDLVVDAIGHCLLDARPWSRARRSRWRWRSSPAPGRSAPRPRPCCRAASAANSRPRRARGGRRRAAASPRRRLPVLTMMSPNSSSLCRRPCALIESWTSMPCTPGDAPTTPAATCTFWSRMAATTSLADKPRCATFCGSSQTRMA